MIGGCVSRRLCFKPRNTTLDLIWASLIWLDPSHPPMTETNFEFFRVIIEEHDRWLCSKTIVFQTEEHNTWFDLSWFDLARSESLPNDLDKFWICPSHYRGTWSVVVFRDGCVSNRGTQHLIWFELVWSG
jgi:hypothetical protein